MSEEAEFTFKILLLGDAAVGKTSLVHRFVHGKFQKNYIMTIGMEPYTRYETLNEVPICYSLWDIAGQDRFKAMRSLFYKGAKGALVTFDVTRPKTLENTINWVKEAKNFSPDLEFILVGNKIDLDELREISTSKGKKKAKEIGAISYFETSAKTGDNVESSFSEMGKILLDAVSD